jgi:alanyl-tRNA synthetase
LVIASANEGKACFAASVSSEWVEKGVHAGKLVGQVAAVADGGGGGKPEKAQEGGKDVTKITLALEEASGYLESVLK